MKQPDNYKKWFSTKQAADYLSMTVRALYEAVRRHEIPVYKFGKRLRFCREELDELLFSNRRYSLSSIIPSVIS